MVKNYLIYREFRTEKLYMLTYLLMPRLRCWRLLYRARMLDTHAPKMWLFCDRKSSFRFVTWGSGGISTITLSPSFRFISCIERHAQATQLLVTLETKQSIVSLKTYITNIVTETGDQQGPAHTFDLSLICVWIVHFFFYSNRPSSTTRFKQSCLRRWK